MVQFEGQVAIVTGAARGLGRAFADALLARGVDVVACDVDEAVHDIEGLTYVADVGDPTAVRTVVDGALAKHRRIDRWSTMRESSSPPAPSTTGTRALPTMPPS